MPDLSASRIICRPLFPIVFSAGCVDYAFCDLASKIRVKNRDPVQVYAMEMEPQEREADLGDDSPVVRQFSFRLLF